MSFAMSSIVPSNFCWEREHLARIESAAQENSGEFLARPRRKSAFPAKKEPATDPSPEGPMAGSETRLRLPKRPRDSSSPDRPSKWRADRNNNSNSVGCSRNYSSLVPVLIRVSAPPSFVKPSNQSSARDCVTLRHLKNKLRTHRRV